MDYPKAKKEVQARKTRENYLVVRLDRDSKFILPHKAGMALMEALGLAEVLKEPWREPHRIEGIDKDTLSITPMSAEEYDRYKIAALLQVTIDEVKRMEQGLPPETPTT